MRCVYLLPILSALLAVPSWAQDDTDRWKSSCVVVPVFHCVKHMDQGGALGYFGYDLQCPEDTPADVEVYIDINKDNLFSPGSKDRGQPKIFVSGKHIDEFEVEFSVAEVRAGTVIHWSVLGQTTVVDFSKTKDESLDCSFLSR